MWLVGGTKFAEALGAQVAESRTELGASVAGVSCTDLLLKAFSGCSPGGSQTGLAVVADCGTASQQVAQSGRWRRVRGSSPVRPRGAAGGSRLTRSPDRSAGLSHHGQQPHRRPGLGRRR